MKILFVLEYYYPNIGGVEKLFKGLTEGLAANGHNVLVITTRFDKNLPKEEIINKVKVKRLNLSNRFLFTFFSIFKILFYGKDYDIIHTTSYNAALPAWVAARILKKKCVITFHEVWGNLWKTFPYLNIFQKKVFSFYEWFIIKLKFDYYVAVSEFTKSRLVESGVPKRKIHKIYNGIDIEHYSKFSFDKPSNFVFTFFGRIGVSKGLDIIIPAAKEIIKKHPESVFKCIIPKTPKSLYRIIMAEINMNNFGDNIQIYHSLNSDSLKNEIGQSSCVVIPSYSEGFCYAAVEATALQIPIISSNKGALKETVSGKHIIMKEFSKAGLVKSLERAYNGNFKYSPQKKYPLSTSFKKYLEFYNKI